MLIWIYGDDGFRVKERVAEMRTKFAEKFDPSGMNVDDIVIRVADDANRGAVMQSVQSSPFLSEKRFVSIRGLATMLKKAEALVWAESLRHTPESTIVVLSELAEASKVEKTELFKALLDAPHVHKYTLPLMQGGELRAWTAAHAKKIDATFVPGALEALLERTGSDAWRIDSELGKLAAYAGRSPITSEHVAQMVRREYEEDVFGLIDVLMRGDAKVGLRRLAEERLAGADDFPLFGMLVRQIRLLVQVKDVQARLPRASKAELATALDLHPFVVQKITSESGRFSQPQLMRLHDMAFRFDRAMKRGLAPDFAVDRLVAEFLQRTEA
jgi:DNA polymerase-3 subunit delta